MKISFAQRAAAIFIFLILFSTCGELDSLFSANRTYQVKTLVNGNSLEDCSIIRSSDKIRPYFAVSVINDPDLIGILVYLQNAQGEVIGDKIRYILEDYADEPVEAETKGKSGETGKETTEKSSETSKETEEESDETNKETAEEEAQEAKAKEQIVRGLPEDGAVKERWSFTDTKVDVKTPAVEIAVESLEQELPYFPLPENLEIGSYTLVFETIGKKEIFSRTETNIFYLGNVEFNLKDISMYLPGLSGSQLISPGTTVLLETRLDFDRRLDPYVIWYNGKNIISEGKISEGAGSILWKAPEQAGFYSLRMEALPFQLKRSNFTGVIREITLPVSSKALSMGYFFENDSQFTSRSLLTEGTAYPEQVQLITTLLASLEENSDDTEEEINKPIMPAAPELLRWYQFDGNLDDSMSTPVSDPSLTPPNAKAPQWAAAGQSYGLSVEGDDPYLLSPVNFFRKEEDQGGGIFLLHIRPPTEGTIFSVFFQSQSSSTSGAWIDMITEKNVIALRLNTEISSVELPVYPAFSELQGFIPIVVEFYIRPYCLEAKISLRNEYSIQEKAGSIKLLSGPLTGEGRIRLGGAFMTKNIVQSSPIENSGKPKSGSASTVSVTGTEKSKTENSPALQAVVQETPMNSDHDISVPLTPLTETDIPAAVEVFTANTIWDELAVLFSELPLLPEESLAPAIIEQDVIDRPETEEIIAETRQEYSEPDGDSVEPLVPVVMDSEDTGSLASLTEEVPTTEEPLVEDSFEEMVDAETADYKPDEIEFSATEAGTDDSIEEEEEKAPTSPVENQIITLYNP